MTQPRTMIHRRVDAARTNKNPAVVCQVPSGWVVMGDDQVTPGYCLLLPDPVPMDLNCLDGEARIRFLNDMVLIGDALLEVTEAYRINYEIMGNTEAALHAHIFPRYMTEPEQYRRMPAWFAYELEKKIPPRFDLERDKPLMKKIANSIQGRL
jgi:diadenosine tetraphosphate (Ap4A) HIT family hydrolase